MTHYRSGQGVIDFQATVTVTKGYIFKSERVFELDCYFDDTVDNAEEHLNWLMDLYARGATANNVNITYSYNIQPADVTPEDYLIEEHYNAVTMAIRNFIGFRNPDDPSKNNDNNNKNSGGGFRYKDLPTGVKMAGGFAAGYKAGGWLT